MRDFLVALCGTLGDDLPVHDIVQHRLDMLRPAVRVVEIAGVFPDIYAEIGWPAKPANP